MPHREERKTFGASRRRRNSIESAIRAASNRETSHVTFRQAPLDRAPLDSNFKIPGTHAGDEMQQLLAFRDARVPADLARFSAK